MRSPWLTMAEAAEYLRFMKDGAPDLLAVKRFLDRHQVPTKYRGRMVLAHVDDIDATLVTRTEGKSTRFRRAS